MAKKLDADLNIIQHSGINIQIDPLTKDLNIIQALDDEPNDVGGLSAQQLKAKFDESGNIIKDYINDSLIPQVLGDGLSEQHRQENEALRQTNEAQRQENEAARAAAETSRQEAAAQLNQALSDSVNQLEEDIEAAEAARNVWEDYDPGKAYVPGNKVYYLGSSYVNTAACTDVLPTVEANWQIVAKKGADSDEGMSQEEADLRYLQLTGGRLTGELRVLDPTKDDNPATKKYVDSVASIIVPVGSIIIWSGAASEIPPGWVLCNGQNGTPDLRDRFVLGGGGTYSVRSTGGEKQHTLTVAEMPNHDHSVRTYPTSDVAKKWDSSDSTNLMMSSITQIKSQSSGSSGSSQPHNNMPPYYTLCYIQYIGAVSTALEQETAALEAAIERG